MPSACALRSAPVIASALIGGRPAAAAQWARRPAQVERRTGAGSSAGSGGSASDSDVVRGGRSSPAKPSRSPAVSPGSGNRQASPSWIGRVQFEQSLAREPPNGLDRPGARIVVADRARRTAPSRPRRPSRSRSRIRPRSQRRRRRERGARRRRARAAHLGPVRRRLRRGLLRVAAPGAEPDSRRIAVARAGRTSRRCPSPRASSRPGRRPGSTERRRCACSSAAGRRTAARPPTRSIQDPPDVCVDRADRAPEGDRGNGPRRVRPDARQALQSRDDVRDAAAVLVDDRPRRAPQVDGAAVVAHPLHARRTSAGEAAARPAIVGNAAMNRAQASTTRPICVCWAMTSDTSIAYGSRGAAERQAPSARRRTRRGSRRARRVGGRPASGRAYHRPMLDPDAAAAPHPVRLGAAFWVQRTDWPSSATRSSRPRGAAPTASGSTTTSSPTRAIRDDGKLEGWATLPAVAAVTNRARRTARRREHVPQSRPDRQARDHHRPDQRRAVDPRPRRRLVRGRARAFGIDFGIGFGERLDRLAEAVRSDPAPARRRAGHRRRPFLPLQRCPRRAAAGPTADPDPDRRVRPDEDPADGRPPRRPLERLRLAGEPRRERRAPARALRRGRP